MEQVLQGNQKNLVQAVPLQVQAAVAAVIQTIEKGIEQRNTCTSPKNLKSLKNLKNTRGRALPRAVVIKTKLGIVISIPLRGKND